MSRKVVEDAEGQAQWRLNGYRIVVSGSYVCRSHFFTGAPLAGARVVDVV